MEIYELDAESYQSFVASNSSVVVHFWASWNQHDVQMRERLSEWARHNGNLIAFASMDTSPEEHWDICRKLNILNLPALVLYRDGRHFETAIGLGDVAGTLGRLLPTHC